MYHAKAIPPPDLKLRFELLTLTKSAFLMCLSRTKAFFLWTRNCFNRQRVASRYFHEARNLDSLRQFRNAAAMKPHATPHNSLRELDTDCRKFQMWRGTSTAYKPRNPKTARQELLAVRSPDRCVKVMFTTFCSQSTLLLLLPVSHAAGSPRAHRGLFRSITDY